LELAALFFNSLIVGFSGAMMPGPLFVVDVAETPRNGWKTGVILSTGHAIAEVFVVLLLLLGAATIAQNPSVAKWIGIIGGVALMAMGVMMASDVLRNKISYSVDGATPHSHGKLTGKGIFATLTNPFWFVWWATVGFGFLVQSKEFGYIGPVVFYFGHILADYSWYTGVAVLVWKGRKLLVGPVFKGLLLACATFLIYLGIKFIRSGMA
jgi:threonine/homoserine/homoserine lactone efflux protein